MKRRKTTNGPESEHKKDIQTTKEKELEQLRDQLQDKFKRSSLSQTKYDALSTVITKLGDFLKKNNNATQTDDDLLVLAKAWTLFAIICERNVREHKPLNHLELYDPSQEQNYVVREMKAAEDETLADIHCQDYSNEEQREINTKLHNAVTCLKRTTGEKALIWRNFLAFFAKLPSWRSYKNVLQVFAEASKDNYTEDMAFEKAQYMYEIAARLFHSSPAEDLKKIIGEIRTILKTIFNDKKPAEIKTSWLVLKAKNYWLLGDIAEQENATLKNIEECYLSSINILKGIENASDEIKVLLKQYQQQLLSFYIRSERWDKVQTNYSDAIDQARAQGDAQKLYIAYYTFGKFFAHQLDIQARYKLDPVAAADNFSAALEIATANKINIDPESLITIADYFWQHAQYQKTYNAYNLLLHYGFQHNDLGQMLTRCEFRFPDSSPQYQELAELIKINTMLNCIALTHHRIEDKNAKLLADALKATAQPVKIILEGCRISIAALIMLAEATTELCLRSKSDTVFNEFISSLIKNKKLARLDLRGCELTEAQCQELEKAKSNGVLKEVKVNKKFVKLNTKIEKEEKQEHVKMEDTEMHDTEVSVRAFPKPATVSTPAAALTQHSLHTSTRPVANRRPHPAAVAAVPARAAPRPATK